jgi:site-specific DNA recombinase
VPVSVIILARISDARDGDEKGVTDQISDGLQLASRLGWGVGPPATHHIVENSTSAFKRRKILLPDGRQELRTVRPGFRKALAMLGDGRADGLIALDLDRTCRDPRDLEDLIDVVEAARPRIPVESVTGSLRLANDGDITLARVMCAVGNKSSRDTARRVARARLRQATEGQFGGGKRRYGFEPDGVTIREAEAAEIRDAADAILAGVSLRQAAAALRERGVPSATGSTWTAEVLKEVLLRPRNAGLMAYRATGPRHEGPPYSDDEIVGRARWDPIIPESTWRALCARLTDPARKTGPGRPPRWLGSRIYRCGVCDDGSTLAVMGSDTGAKRYPRYTCVPEKRAVPEIRGWHLGRAAVPVDEFVTAALIARLCRPDAADLIPAADEVDVAALRAEESSLRELLLEQARLHARRLISGEALAAGSLELQASLDRVRAAISAEEEASPLAGVAGQANAGELWSQLDLGRKRAMLRVLADVTIGPAVLRGKNFDSSSVHIAWRHES